MGWAGTVPAESQRLPAQLPLLWPRILESHLVPGSPSLQLLSQQLGSCRTRLAYTLWAVVISSQSAFPAHPATLSHRVES